jgi:hypothetical protein
MRALESEEDEHNRIHRLRQSNRKGRKELKETREKKKCKARSYQVVEESATLDDGLSQCHGLRRASGILLRQEVRWVEHSLAVSTKQRKTYIYSNNNY